MSILVDPRQAVLACIEIGMRPPPPADLNVWAEANIVFGSESPIPGPYRRSTIPPAARVLECLGPEHPCRSVTIKSSAQFFKTTIGQIFIGGSMDIAPCQMGYTLPTHDIALRWARSKWKVMRKNSRALSRIFGEAKTRDATDTTLYQETKDARGSLQISGSNSSSSLSMASWPKQVQDEVSKWEGNDDGDPEGLADDRSSAFEWAKILKISTPLLDRTCRITRAYRAGTQERFHVPCPHEECGVYQPLEWTNLQANIKADNPADAHFTCVACGAAIEHKHKISIVARGKWVAENPSAREPSFYIWRAYSPFRDWESIVLDWLAAEGDPQREQRFFNSVVGMEFERASDAPPWESIRDRANAEDGFEVKRIQPGALRICAGVDCQGDRTEVHIKGFGEHLRRWTIDYQIIEHHISTVECRDALDKILLTKWPDRFGNQRGLDLLAIDGNYDTNDVFGWVKERKHSWFKVIIVRGAKSDHAPPLALVKSERRADGKTRRTQQRFFNIGVSGLKSSLYEHLKKIDPLARGYCAFPRSLPDEFYMQLTAETRVVENDKWGFPRATWRKDRERNEVLDTEIYAEAAAIRCGFYNYTAEQWAALRADREKINPQGQNDMFDPANPPPLVPEIPLPIARPATAVGEQNRANVRTSKWMA